MSISRIWVKPHPFIFNRNSVVLPGATTFLILAFFWINLAMQGQGRDFAFKLHKRWTKKSAVVIDLRQDGQRKLPNLACDFRARSVDEKDYESPEWAQITIFYPN